MMWRLLVLLVKSICGGKMIVAHLTDGLGNQMFQYALAKALAIQNNTDIIFDMSWYEIKKVSW